MSSVGGFAKCAWVMARRSSSFFFVRPRYVFIERIIPSPGERATMGKGSTTCTGGVIAPSMTQETRHLLGGAATSSKGASVLFPMSHLAC